MGKIIRNGVDYSGLNVFANGVFVDMNNVIQASTTYSASNPLLYTATQDCFVKLAMIVDLTQSEKNVYAYVDGVQVYRFFANVGSINTGVLIEHTLIPLKRGQTLTATTGRADNASDYVVYGVQQGTLEDNPFEIKQISKETMSNVSLTSNADNLVKTMTFVNKGFYILSICDTYNRNSNRSYLHTSIASGDGIIYNSGGTGITDVLSDFAGYSTFVHTWLIQTFKPNVSMQLRWWGNGYNINSLDITLFQVKGMVSQTLPDYSTTEHKTGRQWLDGRDIYEITFDVSANPITLTNNWSTVGALAGVDFIVSATASCGGCIEGAVEVQYSGGNVIIERIGLNSGDTRQLTYLTIQYVKT